MAITILILGFISLGVPIYAAATDMISTNAAATVETKEIPPTLQIDTAKITPPPTNNLATTNDQDISKKIKEFIHKLGSTAQITDQSFAKNQLIKLDKQALPYLNDGIKNDKRTYARIQMANILGNIKDESSIDALTEVAKSQYPALNKAAVNNLGKIGGSKVVSALEQLKSVTKDNEVMQAIEEILTKLKK